MTYEYTVTMGDTRVDLSLEDLLKSINNFPSSHIEKIRIWRLSYPCIHFEADIIWSTMYDYLTQTRSVKTIQANPALNGLERTQAMDALIYGLLLNDIIPKKMYDKYWDYRINWPTGAYMKTIKAEDTENDKLICFVDQITGQKFYSSEQVANSIAKQIADDINIPWGDSEGYSKYFKGGDMKININTGGYTSDNYTSLTRSYLGQMYNPYQICTVKIGTGEPSSGHYKCEKGLDSVIRKVQINEKKKVCTIVWTDGEVTMAKCGENDIWDPEKGLLVCIAKRFWVSGTQFNKWLKAQIPEPVEESYEPKHAAE